jgi:(p)ppGpp synthase/HD superfamily hydrolase
MISLLTKALVFGSRKHSSQRRKVGDIPYINHPIEVADILARAKVDDINILCAAILHDTV